MAPIEEVELKKRGSKKKSASPDKSDAPETAEVAPETAPSSSSSGTTTTSYVPSDYIKTLNTVKQGAPLILLLLTNKYPLEEHVGVWPLRGLHLLVHLGIVACMFVIYRKMLAAEAAEGASSGVRDLVKVPAQVSMGKEIKPACEMSKGVQFQLVWFCISLALDFDLTIASRRVLVRYRYPNTNSKNERKVHQFGKMKQEYDRGQWREQMQKLVMGFLLLCFIHFQFGPLLPLAFQLITAPLEFVVSPLFETFLVGNPVAMMNNGFSS